MVSFEMLGILLEVLKSVHKVPVIPVTKSTEDVQVLLSPALMMLEMVPDLLASSDPSEVADLAFDPGECLQVGLGAGEDNVAHLVPGHTKMFQPQVPEDVLQSLVEVPVRHVAQVAGESELSMTLSDVTLSCLSLPGNCLATVRAELGEDTAR